MKRLVALFLAYLISFSFAQAVEETENPNAWVVRTFHLPPDFLSYPQRDDLPGEINSNTPAADVVAVIKEISKSYGYPENLLMPLGSAGIFDKKSGTYVLRTTSIGMERFEFFIDSCNAQVPRNILYTLHIIEADGATLRQVAREASTLFNHATIWKRLQDLKPQGQIKHLNTLRLETHSAQKAKVESTHQIKTPMDFTLDEKSRVTCDKSVMSAGASFEVDPVLGSDGVTVANDFSFEYHYSPPTTRNEKVNHSVVNAPLVMNVTDFHRVKINTATFSESGNIKLISLWKPQGTPEFEDRDILQAAFLQTEVVKLFWASPNKDLEKIFLAHVDQAVPLPKEPPTKIKIPQGMKTRTYIVPPDFLSLVSATTDDKTAPADPFASTNTGSFRTTRYITAVDVLTQQGIQFPAGATAFFHKSARKLTVTNTFPNLDQVDAFIDSIRYCPFRDIVFTLHLIQADGTIMRQIVADNSATSDQAEALLSLEKLIADGKAKSLQVLRLETRSGQRTTTEAGPVWTILDILKAEEKGKQTFHHAFRPVGTQFTVDPVIGPDGYTIDVELALEHHFALPSARSADPEKTQGVIVPAIDLHFAKINTFITTSTGLTKLIGLWKPEGAAEFENKDLMQAAFLTATIVDPETDKKR